MTDSIEAEDLASARAFAAAGNDEAARAAYMRVINRDPTHFEALIELGNLAFAGGYRTAARTAYEQAVAHHPDQALGHVNLAHILAMSHEPAAAKQHFLKALDLVPDFAAAHIGLAVIYAEEGDVVRADAHSRLGLHLQPVLLKPYRGDGTAPHILMLVCARGGNIPTERWLTDLRYNITTLHTDHVDERLVLPPHDVVFNAIGDADLTGPALQAACGIAARTTKPVINPPERVLPTGRLETSARLGRIDGVCAPEIRQMKIPEIRATPDLAFPLLLRRPGFHTGQHFDRVDTRVALISALDAFEAGGAKDLFLIEYIDARGADDRARKYRVMFIDGRLYPLHLAVSNDWKVHYFSAAMADDQAFRDEEARFLADPARVVGARGWAALEAIATELGLDYAGIDFGLAPDGTILLFEANATMVLIPPGPEPIWDYRRPAIDRAFAACEAMMAKRIASAGVSTTSPLPESV